MRKIRAHLLTLLAAALALAAPSIPAAAQDKGKEAQKPPTGTADAWRQALPPEAEKTGTPEASAPVAQQRATREETEKALIALERKWIGAL